MKRTHVVPFIGKVIVHPGALEAWFARVDDRVNKLEFEAQGSNITTHEPVSKKLPSSLVSEASFDRVVVPDSQEGRS
jgi:hypothetical protein